MTKSPEEILAALPRHEKHDRFAYIDEDLGVTPESVLPLVRERLLLGVIFTKNSNVFPEYSDDENRIRDACQNFTGFSFTSTNDTVGLEEGSAVIVGNGDSRGFYVDSPRTIEPNGYLSDYFNQAYMNEIIRMGMLTEKGSSFGEYGYTIIHANPQNVKEGFFSIPHEHENLTNLKCNKGAGTVCLLADYKSGEVEKADVVAHPDKYEDMTYALQSGDFMMMAKHVLHWTSPKISEQGQHVVVTHNPMRLNYE